MKLILVFLLAVLAADVSGQQQQQRPTLPPSSSSRLPSCPTNLPRIRREIHEISDQTTGQLNAKGQSFLKGVQCLQKTPSPSSGGSIWDEFIQVHLNVLTYAHNHAPFLPWHRMFLLTFEEAMRQCTNDSSITVPYWDASLNSQNLETSPILNDLGGDGQGGCIPFAPFQNLFVQVPQQHCISRRFSYGQTVTTADTVDGLLLSQQSFTSFSMLLEGGLHASVHGWVGGDMAVVTNSPGDPLFYLHHANMDRIYAAWQAENPSIAYTYMQYPNDPFTSDAEIMDMGSLSRYWKSSSISVRLLYNISNWCYGYSYGATPLQSPQDGQRQQQLLQQQPPVQRITQTPQQKQQQTNSVSRLSSLTSSPGNSNSNGQGTVVWNNDFWSLLGFKNHNRLVKRHYRYESSGRSFNDGIQIYNGDYYRLVEQQQQPQLQYPKYPPPPASYHGSPQNPVTPPSYDRNDWYNIRHATPLTDSMIQMHGYNQTLIRYYEFVARGFVDYINADPTHISTCAIINHTPGQLYRSRTA